MPLPDRLFPVQFKLESNNLDNYSGHQNVIKFQVLDLIKGYSLITYTRALKEDLAVDFSGAIAEVTKIMAAEPRRISEIHVTFHMNIATDDKTKTILERTAMTCPVLLSLHPDIEKEVTFNWK